MSGELFGTLIGIAAVDALNPSLFIVQLLLLATAKPALRVMTFILGILVVNFCAGLLLLAGVCAVLTDFLASLSPNVIFGAQAVLGGALLAFGLWLKPDAATHMIRSLPLKPGLTFVLGMGVMLDEMTTALPLVFAAERLAQARLTLPGNILALLLYQFVFSLPLLGFLAGALLFRGQFTASYERSVRAISVWVPRLSKYALLLIGVALLFNALAFFARGQPLIG